jgi:DNA-directed RNA polymerase specialized sigma24 family protein
VAFPTTHWSLLAQATLNGDANGRAALARICSDYRGPVVAFLRTRGYAPEAAEDLAHDFFLQLIQSVAWKRADRARGRFRTFLLGALMHVLDHAREREHAAKRGAGAIAESLDLLAESGFEPAAIPAELGNVFDREWALKLVEDALAAVEHEFAATGPDQYSILKRFLPGAASVMSYEEAAHALQVPVGTVKTWVHRLRTRFRELLRGAVASTVSAPHEIDDELAYLRQVLTSTR